MLFNSIEFILFFPLVFLLYWTVFNRISVNSRNLFLLISSYFFYAWWDFRFLGLIILSSFTDYYCGLYIFKSKSTGVKKTILAVSILINLSVLFTFKYFNFFANQLSSLFESIGYSSRSSLFNVVLPVGISFYTFQTLSYTIDIYRGQLKPTTNTLTFFSFVTFFPQLVAGPIERAKHLLPQFNERKVFDYSMAANGFRLILWGLFAKIAVADSVAPIVDKIFTNYETLGAASLTVGAILFSVQIFGDFAGYSNIAIGTAALLGFNLVQNFNNPYFSRNIKEFWSKWHISLSTWFRDYVYIPLGGNRCSKMHYAVNILLTFSLSGLWHGANWPFLFWGLIHGIFYLVAQPFMVPNKQAKPAWKDGLSMLFTFSIVTMAFVFFRSNTIQQAFTIVGNIMHCKRGIGLLDLIETKTLFVALFFSALLFTTEWLNKNKKHGLDIGQWKLITRHSIYYSLIIFILFSFQTDRIFIYFQF